MGKLIRLEWKKNHIGKYIRNAAILTALLCLFLFAMAYLGIADDPDTGVPDAAPGAETISSSVELLTGMAFLVYTGVMLSSFIISAYKNKTMNLMFSYPIRRQKILAAQMLAVWIFNFAALTLSKLLIYGCILAGSLYKTPAFAIDFDMAAPSFYVQTAASSAVIVTMGFIALYVGLAAKSSKAAVVTSFLLILLTQANIGGLTFSDSAILPAALVLASLVFAGMALEGAEKRDVM